MRGSLLLFAAFLSLEAPAPAEQEKTADVAFFETRIRPLLSAHCYSCHSAKAEKLKGNLFLDSREGMLKGGDSGPALVPGHPEKSRLIEGVRYLNEDFKMPPKAKLSDAAVADLVAWVKMGAPWPSSGSAVPGVGGYSKPDYDRLRREHWAWQPLRKPAPGEALDRLILSALEANGLHPVAPADRYTLIRRATFDLAGLPPTPDEVRAFVEDRSPDAFARVVDRLLASRHFGERWGRHWLDVTRYAESAGSTRNIPYPYAWRYRDYVVAAFNENKPFPRFIREQIAGDLLPGAGDEERIATGFLALGVKDLNERNNEQYLMDNIDDQIDVTSRAFLALTVSCARCHDHKFDPIETADYYALAGIFKSTTELSGVRNRGKGNYFQPQMLHVLGRKDPSPPTPPPEPGKGKARKKKGKEAESAPPPPDAALAMGVREGAPVEARICIRGEVDNLGPAVPRGVLPLLQPARPVAKSASGRLDLAEWLASPENPLPARVFVNRVWQHLFGEGLVRTVDNFGVTGERPSHPELLDGLASRFLAEGGSVKKLIREIILSGAYQRGSETTPRHLEVDPGNRLLWRMAPRRLDAEALRDAILSTSGRLALGPPAGSPVQNLPPSQEIGRGKKTAPLAESVHRSVYLPIVRDQVPDVLQVFDFADPGTLTGRREVTTVATQALLLMNSAFVTAQAKAFSERVLAAPGDDAARVDAAYLRALSRLPAPEERARALKFVSESGSRAPAWAGFCQALLASAEFRYLNVPPPAERSSSDVRR